MTVDPREYLRSLSDEQRLAAVTVSDPVTIIACAGSGKTRTLIGRSIQLMSPESLGGMGADPSSIMMVTFTNKAAREMRERIKPVIDGIRNENAHIQGEPWIGTFHGLSLRILRVEAARAGLGPNFSIFDESDAAGLAKEVSENLQLEAFDVDDFFRDLEIAKARLLSAELLAQKAFDIHMAREFGEEMSPLLKTWEKVLAQFETKDFTRVYTAYQAALDEQNAVDFSDLMNRVTKLFQENEDVRNHWRSLFRHFMVDEMQDMNRAQVAWLDMLTDGGRQMHIPSDTADNEHTMAGGGSHAINGYRVRKFPRPTVAFVGDDDQSIYAFRGSDPSIMKLLGNRYPNLTTRFLDESYRCQKSILTVADSLVSRNNGRFDKQIRPADPDRAHRPILIEKHNRPEDEIRRLVAEARAHIAGGGDPSEFAVLTRTRDLAKAVARDMRAAGLPVTEGKASDIRKTAEVRDAMAFAGFITNPDAEVYMRRIINKPARGLGPTSMARVGQNARLKNISYMEELRSIIRDRIEVPDGGEGYKDAFKSKVKAFGTMIVDMRRDAAAAVNAADAIRGILEAAGYLPEMRHAALRAAGMKDGEVLATDPRAFLVELITRNSDKPIAGIADMGSEDLADRAGQLSEASRRLGNIALLLEQAERHPKLDDFMQEATLEMNQKEQSAGIQVMTVHASKGLEFDIVRMPFMMEGVFPHSRALDEGEESIEEERRLAYVALTRAREDVRVSFSWNVRGSMIRARDPKQSRFIEEMLDSPRVAVRFATIRSASDPVYTSKVAPGGTVAMAAAPVVVAAKTSHGDYRDHVPDQGGLDKYLTGRVETKAPVSAAIDPVEDPFAPMSDADFERMYAEASGSSADMQADMFSGSDQRFEEEDPGFSPAM